MKSNVKRIWVNPVERLSFQGRHKQVYTINTGTSIIPTVSMNKTREDNTSCQYNFPPNPNTGKLETGLNKLVENPFLGFDPDDILVTYKLSSIWKDIIPSLVTKDSIKKQTLFEIKHGVEPDLYTDEIRYSMVNMPSNMDEWGKKTFLQSLNLILYPRPNLLENTTPRQELLMEMVHVLPTIANNKMQVNSAYHDWYISEEHEEEMEKAKKQEIVEKAMYHLYKLKNEYGRFRAYQVAIVLLDSESRPILKGKVNADAVNNTLSDFISNRNQNQMSNINAFMKAINLTETREGIERLDINYLVQQAINTNVIAHRDNEYVWHSKAGTPDVYKLGSSYDGLINFFFKEYKQYNPEGDITNWYKDLLDEVKSKGIEFE